VFVVSIGLLIFCTACGSGAGGPTPDDGVTAVVTEQVPEVVGDQTVDGVIDGNQTPTVGGGETATPDDGGTAVVTETVSEVVGDQTIDGVVVDGNQTSTTEEVCQPPYPTPTPVAPNTYDGIREARRYSAFHRVAPLSDGEIARAREYIDTPCFAYNLFPLEAEALGCKESLYHSAFARVRWPDLDRVEPTAEEAIAYVESFVGDSRYPENGVPFTAPFLWETTNDVMARWILDHIWVDPDTGEWPVRRWLIWDKDTDDDLAWVNAPYPANRYPENPNWHNDDGKASSMWPLDPLSEVELLRARLEHRDAYPEYGEGQGRTVTVHIDNFNAPSGGNRPFRGWVLGNEHREAYKEMIRRMADLLHSRGMFLIVNNLRADHPQDLWDLPFDGLHKEYSFSEDELKRVRQLLKGRVFYAKNRTEMDSLEVAQRIFDYGGRPKSIWPGETRPAEWFKPCGTLAGQWEFDEAQGVEAQDFTFYNNHGRLRGAPEWVKGKKGAALLFDGSGDGVDIDPSDSLSIAEQVSVAMWIRPLRDAAETASGGEDILLGPSFRIRLLDGLTPTFAVRDTAVSEASADDYWVEVPSSLRVALDQWTHLAATYDSGTREMRIYIDGALVGTRVTGQEGDGRLDGLETGVELSGLANPYQGMIDDVSVYRRVLSDEEVKELRDEAILVAHWRLDEEEGEYSRVFVANDSSAFVNYGVVSGGCQWAPGVNGNALRFPGGAEDRVEIKQSESLEVSETLTIAAWLFLEPDAAVDVSMDILLGPSYRLTVDGANRIRFAIHDLDAVDSDVGDWSTLESASSIANGQWVHVAASYEYASQEMRIYIDGTLDSVRTVTLDATACGVRGLESLSVPSHLSSETQPYSGLLDDVRIYNATLSSSEVLAVLND
jgi:hypothetical protein